MGNLVFKKEQKKKSSQKGMENLSWKKRGWVAGWRTSRKGTMKKNKGERKAKKMIHVGGGSFETLVVRATIAGLSKEPGRSNLR